MVSVAEQYMNEMHDQFLYFATWTPDMHLDLGDVGVLNKNEFTRVTNLDKLDINYIRRSSPAKSEENYASNGVNKVSTKINVLADISQIPVNIANLDIIVDFSGEKGIFFEAAGVRTQTIEDLVKLDHAIIEKYDNKKWQGDWVVIYDLKIADSATVLISQGKSATVGLKANSNVSTIPLANLSAGFDIVYKKNMSTTIVCQNGLTPLFKVRGIKGWPWPKVKPIKMFQKPEYPYDQSPHEFKSSKKMVDEINFIPFK